jgi:hypothetical protein
VIFNGNSATLKLDAPAAFTAAIEQVVVGDAIDLAGITANSATYSGPTLTINETNGQKLIYNNVSGSLAGYAVTVASDNNGGTLVYWGAAPAATTQYWIAGVSCLRLSTTPIDRRYVTAPTYLRSDPVIRQGNTTTWLRSTD